MDTLTYVFEAIGTAINGALQVLVDFLNLIIEVVPNPDPFQQIVEDMPTEVALDWGFVLYWIDAFIGVEEAGVAINTFIVLMIASSVFAFIYMMARWARG